jgi:hypothetical protein
VGGGDGAISGGRWFIIVRPARTLDTQMDHPLQHPPHPISYFTDFTDLIFCFNFIRDFGIP